MTALKNLKIGTRLALVLAGVLLALCAVAATGMWGINALSAISNRVLTQDIRLAQQASEIQNLVLQERRFEKDAYINLGDADKLVSYTKKWKDAHGKLMQAIEQSRRLELCTEDTQALDQMSEHLKSYAAGFESTLAMIKEGKIQTTQEANTELSKVKAAVHGMESTSDAVNERAMARAASAGTQVSTVRTRAQALQIALAAVGLVLAVVLCVVVTRSITRPIAAAVKVAETVAAGDLSSHIEVGSRDETGQLMAALKRMNDSLVGIVGQVRGASDSIATGSSQIANGNADLSQRTEEQASNLQQTAASMEQLTATVKQNADTARQATQLATSASTVAQEGGDVVGQVITTMGAISTSSKKISDIIGVIDSIAFQTNILALNAAVEAARAG